tara:strand:+ start:731 stop:1186 length:456 start_codon:yes stop_codon:yes gene_type:complete
MTTHPWLTLTRTVRFGDTDAAGVMHFHQLLRWCHEAWEESLELYGIEAGSVFPGCRDQERWPDVALPVVHCNANFQRAVHGGDQLRVKLTPRLIDQGSFEVHSQFLLAKQEVANGLIRQLAIHHETRRRCPLPEAIALWLEAAQIGKIREQ